MKLREMLKKQGIDEALEHIGFHIETIFCGLTQETSDLYCQYEWSALDCSVPGIKNGYVIHAFPSKELVADAPWEEWFYLDGEPHHHVLFLQKKACCENSVEMPLTDVDHPVSARGLRWYYYADNDARPYAAR